MRSRGREAAVLLVRGLPNFPLNLRQEPDAPVRGGLLPDLVPEIWRHESGEHGLCLSGGGSGREETLAHLPEQRARRRSIPQKATAHLLLLLVLAEIRLLLPMLDRCRRNSKIQILGIRRRSVHHSVLPPKVFNSYLTFSPLPPSDGDPSSSKQPSIRHRAARELLLPASRTSSTDLPPRALPRPARSPNSPAAKASASSPSEEIVEVEKKLAPRRPPIPPPVLQIVQIPRTNLGKRHPPALLPILCDAPGAPFSSTPPISSVTPTKKK